MSSLWCLYDKKQKIFHNPLTLSEARAIFRTLSPFDHKHWLVWKVGWRSWNPINQVVELTLITTDGAHAIEVPSLPNDIFSIKKEFSFSSTAPETSSSGSVPLSLEKESQGKDEGKEDRKTERIIGELAVEIICRDRRFQSTTRDISLKGLQLADAVPEWVGGYFTLILSRPDVELKLEFICSIVENQQPGQKFRLEIQPSKDSINLKRWLLDLHLKNIKKSTG